MANVTLYENPGFTGLSVTLGIGQNRFLTPEAFNDFAASILVPAGLVAYIYEHANDFGGYGIAVDLMEDCVDLAAYGLSKKVSYVDVFSATNDRGLVWARAIGSGPSFVPGHWERARANGQLPPNPGVGAVGPPVPPRTPR